MMDYCVHVHDHVHEHIWLAACESWWRGPLPNSVIVDLISMNSDIAFISSQISWLHAQQANHMHHIHTFTDHFECNFSFIFSDHYFYISRVSYANKINEYFRSSCTVCDRNLATRAVQSVFAFGFWFGVAMSCEHVRVCTCKKCRENS